MKKNIFKLLLLITMLAMSSGDFLAQVNWTKYPGNPVLTGGPSGSWNHQIYAPRVLYNSDSSRYEMWFSASSAPPLQRPWKIGYAFSSDGVNWTMHPTPVLNTTSGAWDSYTVEGPIVIRENGQYKMWYNGGTSDPSKIGYAISPDGINWTKHPNPVLVAGTDFWESGGVYPGQVMPYEGGYKMWYSGWDTNPTPHESIGYATSPDGITWQRFENNPVLSYGSAGVWDDLWVAFPSVLLIDNIYYMWYCGVGDVWANLRVGLATSSDGLLWVKHPANPVLKPTAGQWDGSEVESASVMLTGDTLYAWYDGSDGILWQIGLAKSLFTPLPLPPGTYTIGAGGNFATIQDAFDKLSTDGVAGNVTLELIDELYTAPVGQYGFLLNGPIPGTGPNSRVTIQPAENKNVTIEGDGEAVFYFLNTSYVTLDGVSIDGSTTLTVHNLKNDQYQFNDAVSFINNSDHNIVENCILISDGYLKGSSGILFFPVTSVSEIPDSNLIENNFVKKAGAGIYVGGKDQNNRAFGNIIRGNKVGSEVDSLISWGIQDQNTQNSIIENNIVQNINRQFNIGYYAPGINTAYSSGTTIRNNVVHKVSSSNVWGSAGILVSGESWAMGNNNAVYNNMIYDIQCTSTNSSSRLTGIQIFNQNNPKIYYNSVYLSGTGTNPLGSAAVYIYTNVTNADIRNNILVSTRDESPYCASAIFDYTAANLASNYNDLYYEPNQYNCLVRAGGDYLTLIDWQATGKDLNSISEMPHFVALEDLHIDGNFETLLDRGATPIVGIETDFDGDTRNAITPDIGADEFTIVGVEDEETLPTEFALEQNFPNPFNPTTTIGFGVQTKSNVKITILNAIGEEVAMVLNEERESGYHQVEFNAGTLPSGVYFYQLKAGEFVQTKKMILIK